jgi:hypothetical protein
MYTSFTNICKHKRKIIFVSYGVIQLKYFLNKPKKEEYFLKYDALYYGRILPTFWNSLLMFYGLTRHTIVP